MMIYELGYIRGGCIEGADDGSAWGALLVDFGKGVEFCGLGVVVFEGFAGLVRKEVFAYERVDGPVDQFVVVRSKVFFFFFIKRFVCQLPIGLRDVVGGVLYNDTTALIGFGYDYVVSGF